MKRRTCTGLLTMVMMLAFALVTQVHADVILYHVHFTATFENAPVLSVTGDIYIPLDLSADSAGTMSGIDLPGLSLREPSIMEYDYYVPSLLCLYWYPSTWPGDIDFGFVTGLDMINRTFTSGEAYLFYHPSQWLEEGYGGVIVGTFAPVPLPPSIVLLGSGLLGLAGWRRFRNG